MVLINRSVYTTHWGLAGGIALLFIYTALLRHRMVIIYPWLTK